MILTIREHFSRYPSAFANWGSVMLKTVYPYYTVVITGKDYREKISFLYKNYHPNVFFCGSGSGSELPIFKDRIVEGETMIYVCSGKECKLPTSSVQEALSYFSQRHTKDITKITEQNNSL
jgi:hypothetical protein